jgi:TP901 family phage tail tape measure protein
MSRFVLTAQLQLQAPNNVAQVVRQIQSQLNNVNVNIQVQNAGQAQRQLQRITQQTNQATTAAERMGRAFAVSVRRFAAFSIATRAVGLFTSTLSDAVQASIDFERQLIKISQVTGESLDKLGKLTGTITSLATNFGVASKDLLDVSTILLQAGLSSKDTEVALKSLAKAALAPNFDSISETAEGAIAVLAQFGKGVDALEGQLGSINAVAGAFAVEAGDLIDVIRRTGGVFKSSGGSLNELLALFTSVRATTRESAESIGTGLRTIFTRIQRPKTIEFLKQFGVELVDLEGKFVGPYEAVRRLSSALNGLGERDITFIRIAEELGGFRQIGKVLPLLQQFSTAEAALNVATKANNSLTKDAATAQLALSVRIVKVKEEFLALVRSITETSTFQIMANTALALASALIKIGDAIKPLLPLLGALAAIKLVKGIGGFLGGAGAGLTSSRTFNKGGRVHAFARGGLVPGVGDTDSVPAMLSPGEFVIRKSSVKSIGAGNLHAMNKYAAGGIASKSASMALTGRKRLSTREMMKASQKAGYNIERLDNGRIALSRNGRVVHNNLTDDEASNLLASMSTGYAAGGMVNINRSLYGTNATWQDIQKQNPTLTDNQAQRIRKGTLTLDKALGNTPPAPPAPPRKSRFKGILNNDTVGAAILIGQDITNESISSNEIKSILSNKFANIKPGYESPFQTAAIPNYNLVKNSLKNPQIFNDAIDKGLIGAANIANQSLATALEVPIPAVSEGAKQNFLRGLNDAARGNLFETILTSMVNKGQWDSNTDPQAPFDYTKGLTKGNRALANLFPALRGIRYVDSKASESVANPRNIANKIANELLKENGYSPNALRAQGNEIKLPEKTKRKSPKKLASGGGVGTDTVPALLTPGEFVINRSSAQNIGYGNLNRMNKVGKYANGGVVQHFAAGGGVTMGSPGSIPGMSQQTQSLQRFYVATNNSTTAQNQNSRSLREAVAQNKLFIASMASSLIQGFLPAVDENSGMLLKMAHGLVGLTTTIVATGAALEAFGLQLNVQNIKSAIDLLRGKGGSIATNAGRFVGEKLAGTRIGGMISPLGTTSGTMGAKAIQTTITGATTRLGALAGGAAVVTLGLLALNKVVNMVADQYDIQTKKRIEAGDVAGAGESAKRANGYRNLATSVGAGGFIGGGIGAIAGGVIGSLVGPLGTAAGIKLGVTLGSLIGSSIGIFISEFGDSSKQAKLLAEAQAGAVRTTKALENAGKNGTQALEKFNQGLISASDLLDAYKSAGVEVFAQNKRVTDTVESNVGARSEYGSGKILRNLGAYLGGGLFGMETSGTRNARLEKENLGNIQKQSQDTSTLFAESKNARNIAIRSSIISGEDPEKLLAKKGLDTDKLRTERTRLLKAANEAQAAGSTPEAKALRDLAAQYESEIRSTLESITNITKEVEIATKKFQALNLGFRAITASSDAAALRVDNFVNSLEAGYLPVQGAVATLEASLTKAGQNISASDVNKALDEVTSVFTEFGADASKEAKTFRENFKGLSTVQRNFPAIFENIKGKIKEKGYTGMSSENISNSFKDEIKNQLKNANIDEDVRNRIVDSIGKIELKPEDIVAINAGQYDVLEKYLEEAGDNAKTAMKNVVDNYVKIHQQLIDLTKRRIEAERTYIESIKESLAISLEAREIQGKYGGKAVTPQERRQNLLDRANVGAGRLGLSRLQRGNAPELLQRNQEIKGRFTALENQRRNNRAFGVTGVQDEAIQRDLESAAKEQITTIRELIKVQEDELRILQEKNKLEKDSLDALISGDVEKFFEQQAGVGATAALATGNQSLINAFGPEALGTAYSDIQRQQEAGVQEINGVRIAGAGGLLESGARAALGARGITDPRAAQVAARTTIEEENLRASIRANAGALGDAGTIERDISEMKFNSATMYVNELKLAAQGNGGVPVIPGVASTSLTFPPTAGTPPTVPAAATAAAGESPRGSGATVAPGAVTVRNNSSVPSAGSTMGIDPEVINRLTSSLDRFNGDLSSNIDRLEKLKITISLDATNVNVNLMGGDFLAKLTNDVQSALFDQVKNELGNYKVKDGKLVYSPGVVPA